MPSGTVLGYVNSATNPTNHYCSGNWSGNFLNWATMTRIDTIRRLLYGGMRSTDSTTSTILERAYFPPDGHAWAKYYNGEMVGQTLTLVTGTGGTTGFQPQYYLTGGTFTNDIGSLTPYAQSNTPQTGTGTTSASPASGSCWGGTNNCYTLTVSAVSIAASTSSPATPGLQIGDQLCLTTTGNGCVLNGQAVSPLTSSGGAKTDNLHYRPRQDDLRHHGHDGNTHHCWR